MKQAPVALGAISILLTCVAAYAAESSVPLLVSPGLPDELAILNGTCPTFSWAGLMRGEAQELVVYEVDESGSAVTAPTLTLRLPALASSWTPAGAQCFDRGKSYAWSLRAIGEAEQSDWGETRFFSVPAGPTEEEFRAGLEVVKAYLALQENESRRGEAGKAPRARVAAEDLSGAGEDSAAEGTADTKIRTARAGVVPGFRVAPGGAVEATSFAGDGSGLTGVGQAAIATNAVGPQRSSRTRSTPTRSLTARWDRSRSRRMRLERSRSLRVRWDRARSQPEQSGPTRSRRTLSGRTRSRGVR